MWVGKLKIGSKTPGIREQGESADLGRGARVGRLVASGKPGSALALLVASRLFSDKTAGIAVVAFGDELRKLSSRTCPAT